MLRSGRIGKLTCLSVGLLIILARVHAMAVPLTLPSGNLIDPTPRQTELLDNCPGAYQFDYRPAQRVHKEVRHWVLVELPSNLGGGVIVATPQDLIQGLDRIDAGDQNETAMTPSINSPEMSDSLVGIEATASGEKTERSYQHNWQWSFDIGYRNDDLDWNIAGDIDGNNPNILSELTWKNLEILQLEFGLERRFEHNWKLKGSLAYGEIFDGENQDSDYFGDNRTFEWSRSNNSADDGHTLDVSIGLGYIFPLLTKAISATPLFGFSFHAQNLIITEGVQTIATPPITPDLGPFAGLNSAYDAKWYGPWVGLDFSIRNFRKGKVTPLGSELTLGFEWHFYAEYYAEADWNLRANLDHPKSFEHETDGSGVVFSGGYNYFIDRQWSLNVSGKYQKWETDPGIDRVFPAVGGELKTRLNEVNWESYSVMLGVTRRF